VLFAWEDLATRQREWRALAERCGAIPEWTPSWCIPWWRELGRGRLRAVAATEDDGTLVGLGLFCESRAPGPKLLTALGRGSDPAVGMLLAPGHEDVAFDIVTTALGSQPAVMVLAGTDDRGVLETGAASHGLAVSARAHAAGRVVELGDLAAAADAAVGAGTGGASSGGTAPVSGGVAGGEGSVTGRGDRQATPTPMPPPRETRLKLPIVWRTPSSAISKSAAVRSVTGRPRPSRTITSTRIAVVLALTDCGARGTPLWPAAVGPAASAHSAATSRTRAARSSLRIDHIRRGVHCLLCRRSRDQENRRYCG